MTGHEIVNAAEVYIGQPIEADMALIAINEAIRVIADMGLAYGTITLDGVEAKKWQHLPDDYTHVLRVYDVNGDIYDNWEEVGGAIRLGDNGDYTIHARRIPTRITSLSQEPEINEGFHNSLVRFVRDFVMQAMSDDFRSKTHNFDAFKEEALKTYGYLSRHKRPNKIKVIRHA